VTASPRSIPATASALLGAVLATVFAIVPPLLVML